MVKNCRAADIHSGTCEIREDFAGCRLFLKTFYFITDIDLSNTVLTRIIN